MVQFAVDLFNEVLQYALPIAIVFEVGNLLVSTVLRVAFGGKLWVGR